MILFTPTLIELSNKLCEQIFLVFVAITVAIVIGIPLGILAAKQTQLKKIILSLTGILQIIPSLALFAFLIPIFGIGIKPAIIALCLYALLPIVSNTVTGLTSVPSENIEAAHALGFTSWQRLWIVELALSLPTIISGIRISTMITMGTATLAAFIGAGGLGDFINRGLALNNTTLLMLGAIPVALLTLILDFLIHEIEMALNKNGKQKSATKLYMSIVLIIVLFLLPLIPFAKHTFSTSEKNNTIRIATANFTEQLILGEILKQLIEHHTHLKVKLYSSLGTSNICFQALLNHQIDLYPEYTDVALLTQLHQNFIGVPHQEVFERAKAAYLQKFNLVWFEPFGFNDNQALAIRDDFATEQRINTISALTPIAPNLILGAPTEFLQRPDGMPGLKKIYHIAFASIKEMEPSLMYEAIKDKKVQVIVAFTTDGKIPAYHLRILTDDKKLFPLYDCAPLVSLQTLKVHPELESTLKLLANTIDNKKMQELNAEVDLKKESPAEVAENFLASSHL